MKHLTQAMLKQAWHKLEVEMSAQSRLINQQKTLAATEERYKLYSNAQAAEPDNPAIAAVLASINTKLARQRAALETTKAEIELDRRLAQGDPAQLSLADKLQKAGVKVVPPKK